MVISKARIVTGSRSMVLMFVLMSLIIADYLLDYSFASYLEEINIAVFHRAKQYVLPVDFYHKTVVFVHVVSEFKYINKFVFAIVGYSPDGNGIQIAVVKLGIIKFVAESDKSAENIVFDIFTVV